MRYDIVLLTKGKSDESPVRSILYGFGTLLVPIFAERQAFGPIAAQERVQELGRKGN